MQKRSGDLKQLGSLFAIYKERLQAPQKTVIDETLLVVEAVTGITIPRGQCSYTPRTKTLSLTCKAALKQEIKRQEPQIRAMLIERLGAKSAPTTIL
jgi:hypothetical protein